MSARDVGFLLDFPIDRKTLLIAVQDSSTAIERERPPLVFACANPHSLEVDQHDDGLQSALTQGDFVVADGVGGSAPLLRTPW